MEDKQILFFDEIDKKDIAQVGGKGANLGEMTKAGFPVPDGFCVTTEAYRKFLEHNKRLDFITEVIKDANLDNIVLIGAQIRAEIEKSEIPEGVTQGILMAVHKIGVENNYAVRSSATAEDLAFASFAGQQDTYLNINGENFILLAVRDCWASLFTDRAILYRIQNKIDHAKVHMAVVIQKMVNPEVSGIMFTADPLSGHRGMISIDASYGLGEALVSGIVDPDIYRFRKSNRQIDNKIIGNKRVAILPIPGGGTKKEAISGEKSRHQVMKDSQIKALAELGMKIEKHYGMPQDIEWCLEKNKLYVVQSRPITSLFPLPEPLPKDEALHAYVSFNHFQVMTDPISPLGIDILRIIFPLDKDVRSESGYQFIAASAGRIYIDLSNLLQFKKLRKGLPAFFKNVDVLLAKALAELVQRPAFRLRIKRDRHTKRALLIFMGPIVINTIRNLAYRKPENTIKFLECYIEKRVRETAEKICNANQGVEKLEAIFEAANFIKDFQMLIPRLAPGMISFKMLESLEQKFLGTNRYVNIMVKGLEGNITTEMGLMVGDLADSIRKSPQLINEFENQDYLTLRFRINQLIGNNEFKKQFNAFMNKYGVRGAGEIDMARSRWIENPEPLVKSIMAIVKTSEEGIHRREYQETIKTAKETSITFVKEVDARRGKVKGLVVKRLVRVLRNVLPTREHPKYLIMNLIFIFKKALLEEAKVLVEKGQLTEAKDVFYVGFWELYAAVQNNKSLVDLVAQRKAKYDHFKKLNAPRVITSDGEEIKAGYLTENISKGALQGIPVSAGVVEGIAKVVTDPTKEAINKGEILVAPFTDPGWTPLFINAAGLVMEIGGLLTHGTVVAREYGIPAVVGVTDVTKKIKTGQKIRVDGNSGFVIILEE
ncbi:MAG: phosphoenolpyruvate synthase [Acetobacterium sp.]